MQKQSGSDNEPDKQPKKDGSLAGLILLSNLPFVIALVAYLIWRFWP